MSPKQKPTKPFAVYTRVSEQGRRSDEELHSHDLQRTKIENYLAAHDSTPAAERFEDTDVSGRKMSRPAFDRAIAGIRSDAYGGIAVARLSRFGRKASGFLNGLGLRTGRDRPWGIEAARKLLMNEVYTGVRKYGDVRIEGAHAGIVPMPLFRKAAKKLGYTYKPGTGLARIGGPVTRTRGEGHVLGEGLVRCGHCGQALVKGSANGKYGTLRCLGSGSGPRSGREKSSTG